MPDIFYSHCHHCFRVMWAGIPCEHCFNAIYCSKEYLTNAWGQYHRYGCTYFDFWKLIVVILYLEWRSQERFRCNPPISPYSCLLRKLSAQTFASFLCILYLIFLIVFDTLIKLLFIVPVAKFCLWINTFDFSINNKTRFIKETSRKINFIHSK